MSYLLDKKIKQKKIFKIALGVVVLIVLFYFRFGIFSGLSYLSQIIFHPVLILGNNVGEKFSSLKSYFLSKDVLRLEIENLKLKINEKEAMMSNYNSVFLENLMLKEILGRKMEKVNFVLSSILGKANENLYDTLIIDAGIKENLRVGSVVFAFGNVPIGRIAETYADSSKVVLFSNSGQKTDGVVRGGNTRRLRNHRVGGLVFLYFFGGGGGNFEMTIPSGLVLAKGDQAVLPGIFPYVVGIVETIISDPRDSFQKALLVSPVNARELKFVEVGK